MSEGPERRRFEGKVVFITGVARGQGREHAVRFAAEGASIVGVDVCADLPSVPYPLATEEDLHETTRRIEEVGGASVLRVADVRDRDALRAVVAEGMDRFGRLDVVLANAGTYSPSPIQWMNEDNFDEVIAINLSGVYRTVRSTIRHLMEGEPGGSIIITSSTAGLKGFYGSTAYCAAKHGVVGFMRALSLEMAPMGIRVNCVHPTSVDTPMIHNAVFPQLVAPEKGADASWEDALAFLAPQQAMDVSVVEARDITNAIMWLASDEARYVTGISLPVDAGFLQKSP